MIVSNQTVAKEKERVEPSDQSTSKVTAISGQSSPAEPSVPVLAQDSKTPPRPRWFKRIAIATTALVAGIGGAGLMLVAPFSLSDLTHPHFQMGNVWSLFQNGLQYPITRPINILVMGIDHVPSEHTDPKQRFAGRSDTMIVVRVDPTTNSASLLSIPRDTQVQIPQVGLAKINEANEDGGPALARDVVSQTLNQLAIDRYVRVSTEAFRELIDELGGVDVLVPKVMKYDDVTQKLHIDLKPGLQRLNGEQAEQFVRFRHDSLGDIGRVQRQQVLLKALREKLSSPSVIPQIPGIVGVLQNYIDTNLSVEEMIALAQMALKIDRQQIQMVMLPGRFGSPENNTGSYWLMNNVARDRVLQAYFNHSAQPDSTSTQALEAPSELKSLHIAVQNASGESGIGALVANKLKSEGFSSVYVIEDWPEALPNSEIVAQQGDLKGAKSMQEFLKLGQIETTSTGDIESDLTIRIGKDWVKQTATSPKVSNLEG